MAAGKRARSQKPTPMAGTRPTVAYDPVSGATKKASTSVGRSIVSASEPKAPPAIPRKTFSANPRRSVEYRRTSAPTKLFAPRSTPPCWPCDRHAAGCQASIIEPGGGINQEG